MFRCKPNAGSNPALSANEINKTRKAINDAGFYFSFEFLKVRESALHVAFEIAKFLKDAGHDGITG